MFNNEKREESGLVDNDKQTRIMANLFRVKS